MRWLFLSLMTLSLSSHEISKHKIQSVCDKIWQNECHRSYEGLTTWNDGEDFISLGIGHFIWYKSTSREMFEELFPELVLFLEKKGETLPEVLKGCSACPWQTKQEFLEKFHSSQMDELRDFLYRTRFLQAEFIISKCQKVLHLITASLEEPQKSQVVKTIEQLELSSKGLFALIDYINFKGSGLNSQESYEGEGWGLKQVLLDMNPSSTDLLREFVSKAKARLELRVKLSPIERGEKRWLKGWHKRLDSYLKN